MNQVNETRTTDNSRFQLFNRKKSTSALNQILPKSNSRWRKRILISKSKKTSFLDRLESDLPRKKETPVKRRPPARPKNPDLDRLIQFVEKFKEVQVLLSTTPQISDSKVITAGLLNGNQR